MLTRRQNQLLDFIDRYQRESGGVSPSFEEIRVAVRLDSRSGVGRLLRQLQERGYVRRLANRERAIEVLRPSQKRPSSVVFVSVVYDAAGIARLDFDNAQQIAFPE